MHDFTALTKFSSACMEKAQNDSLDESDHHVAVTTPLLVDSEGETRVFIEKAVESDNMETNQSENSSEHHDEPVDVVGGEDEFAFVPKSGIPVTVANEEDETEGREFDPEIPTITHRLSRLASSQNGFNGWPKAPSVLTVDVDRKPSIPQPKKHGLQGLSESKKHALGLFLIGIHCLTIVGSNQFAKSTYTDDFSAPFFLVYFRTVCRIIIFPCFMVLKYFHRASRKKTFDVPFMKTFYSCTSVFGPEGLTLKSICYPCGLLSALWCIVQFAHVLAVKYLNNSVTQALFCSETAFCYLLSALILKVPVYVMKVAAVALALVGVGLMAYSQSGDELRWEGITICLVGAFLGSSYMVAVKKTLGKTEDVGQALLLTSGMSAFVTVTCWPIVLALYYGGVERWLLETFPWGKIFASSGLTLVSISIFNLCLTLTNPLLMTLSKLMGIPINYVIDWMYWDHKFDAYQIVGVFLIGVGFVFIALPERWLALKKLKSLVLRKPIPSSPVVVVVSNDEKKEKI